MTFEFVLLNEKKKNSEKSEALSSTVGSDPLEECSRLWVLGKGIGETMMDSGARG